MMLSDAYDSRNAESIRARRRRTLDAVSNRRTKWRRSAWIDGSDFCIKKKERVGVKIHKQNARTGVKKNTSFNLLVKASLSPGAAPRTLQ